MEHIIQFAVNIDDDRIRRFAEEKATQAAVEQIKEGIKKQICGSGNAFDYSHKIAEYAEQTASQFYENHKDEIIERAAARLADRLAKTKAVKSMLQEELDKI